MTMVLAFIAVILLYLLFAPFYLEIYSDRGLYRIRFHYLLSLRLEWGKLLPELSFRIAGWQKRISWGTGTEESIKPEEAPEKEKRASQGRKKRKWYKSGWLQPQPVLKVLKSFKVEECYVNLDTDDVSLNGQLYPWFYLAGRYIQRPIFINFLGEQTVRLRMSNTLARIVWTFITNYKIKHHARL